MAQENNGMGLGEISTIRNILMGQEIADNQKKFGEIDARHEADMKALIQRMDDTDAANSKHFAALEQEMNERFTKLREDMDTRFNRLEKDVSERFDRLEALLEQNMAYMEDKLANTSKTDKALVGQLLQQIGGQLITGGE